MPTALDSEVGPGTALALAVALALETALATALALEAARALEAVLALEEGGQRSGPSIPEPSKDSEPAG